MIKNIIEPGKEEFKRASFLTPVFMILEVVVETMIPVAMALMIDNGVEKQHVTFTAWVLLWRYLLLQV